MNINFSKLPFLSFLGTLKYYLFVETYYRFLAKFGRHIGTSDIKRNPQLIISLTTFSERFSKVHLCIEALLRQSLKPDRFILWVSIQEKSQVPQTLLKLQKRGLEIRYCDDIRSYKKIIYTLKEFPNDIIVTADDDLLYSTDWLEKLFAAYQQEPQFIHCHKAHKMTINANGTLNNYKNWIFGSKNFQGPSLLLFPTGSGGVLYPPKSLNQEVTNTELFIELCPTADDVWLKAMSLLNNTPCKKINPFNAIFTLIKGTQEKALWKENTGNQKNDTQIKAAFDYFNLYSKLR